jgi:hypothetical protein
MSDPRTAYILQVLEKIGAPLMGAITDGSTPDDPTNEAQIMAALLSKTVQASIELGNTIETDPLRALDDSVRVTLAALASTLVAGQYRRRAQIPDDLSLKKITSSLQAVLSFSENFAPNPENAARLRDLEAKGQPSDPTQTQIQYVQAFIPVVEAIAAFPFGQPEQKLLVEVSNRLIKKSIEMREILLPGMVDEGEQKRAELGFLRALAVIYSAAHRAETDKALRSGDDARMAGLSMQPVWAAFELRAAMLEALSGTIVPLGKGGSSARNPAAPQANAPETPPAPPPIFQAPPQQPPQPATPPIFQAPPAEQAPVQPAAPPIFQAPPQQAQQQPAGANPMSMFAKKPDDGAAPPPPPPQAPPIFQAPPPETPPYQPPSQQPPAAQPTEEKTQSESGDGGGGNPMSFFKKSE